LRHFDEISVFYNFMSMRRFHLAVAFWLSVLPLPAAVAQTTPATPATPQPAQPEPAPSPPADTQSTYDKIWQQFTTLYDSKSNPVVQRVLFTGRFQHEFVGIGADQGDLDEWNTRRFRVGPRVTLFRNYTLHVEAELNPQEIDPLYMRLTDAYLQWSESPRLAITVGKQSIPYTMDGATSSKELLTIDRSNLTNNIWFPQEYLPGVGVSGKIAPWNYRLTTYSAGQANKEFGEFNGGVATLAVVGYDFADVLGVDEALLSGNYVHQTPDVRNTFTRQLEDIVSINLRVDSARWGLRADVSTAGGYLGQSDIWGLMAMPYLNITDKWQVIGRYTFLSSEDVNGLLLGTYENRIVRGRGDEYKELYLGANYFFYGHKLKLQTGLQFADMSDRAGDGGEYSGTSWTTGLRVGW
jgi:phosphate-selective porin OprO/OprP